MKTQLIILNTPIIVSDEKIRERDLCFDLEANPGYNNILYVTKCLRTDDSGYWSKNTKKIIAGLTELPKIDFNGFEEQLGIVDVEKLAYEDANKVWCNKDSVENEERELQGHLIGFIEGFKAAQKLNEKKFSLEDIKNITNSSIEFVSHHEPEEFNDWFNKKLNKISKPKVFDIEVEMEEYCLPMPNIHVKEYRPKITNNSIKIVKIL